MLPTAQPASPAAALLTALCFAAEKHSQQRRKDLTTPYINHPIQVAETLAHHAHVTDLATLQAAILHDTLEDTQTTPSELEELFGPQVRSIVQEVTDDKTLPHEERKQQQIESAPHLSIPAQLVRVADKICNVRDITPTRPVGWPLERKVAYLDWAERVVLACPLCTSPLLQLFRTTLDNQRRSLQSDALPGV